MLFPISDALAAGEAASAGGMESFLVQVVPLIVIFVVFWFFLIRPQQKRQKEHAKMCDALAKGDEVMTMGGISGRIESVDEQSMALQVASVDGKPVVIRMQRSAVQMVLPKGSVKFYLNAVFPVRFTGRNRLSWRPGAAFSAASGLRLLRGRLDAAPLTRKCGDHPSKLAIGDSER